MAHEFPAAEISGSTFASEAAASENGRVSRAPSGLHERHAMRSVFPALQDRLLATLLWTALAVLAAMVLAASVGGGDVDAAGSSAQEVPPQFVFGATPAQ